MVKHTATHLQTKANHVNFNETFVTAGTASVIAKTTSAPLERIKLLMQNQDKLIKQNCLDRQYSGIIDCAKHTLRNEGLLSFWRGNLVNVTRYTFTQGCNFHFKDAAKYNLFGDPKSTAWKKLSYQEKLTKNIISGGVAGSFSQFLFYHLDLCRTRLANDINSKTGSRVFNGVTDVYVKILRSDGITGLYRGFVISCVGKFVYRGIYFGLYDSLKPVILHENDQTFSSLFLLGWFVTATAGFIDYPIDTTRRYIMMTSGGNSQKYRSSFECAKDIKRTHGFKGFYKGVGANILRGMAGAIALAGTDKLKDIYIQIKLSY